MVVNVKKYVCISAKVMRVFEGAPASLIVDASMVPTVAWKFDAALKVSI